MKSSISKYLIAAAVTGTAIFGSANAFATATYPLFSVSTADTGVTNVANVDKIIGNYFETFTTNANGTFTSSILWEASAFVNTDPVTGFSTSGGATGLGVNTLFATFLSGGTYVVNGSNITYTFAPSISSLQLYVDLGGNITANGGPVSGTTVYTPTFSGGSNVVLLGTGGTVQGQGSVGGATNNLAGAFGVTDTLSLNAAGRKYFTAPIPFYNLTIADGQINGFNGAVGTTHVNGSFDVIFNVPEPASLALLGIGLLGFGFRKSKAA